MRHLENKDLRFLNFFSSARKTVSANSRWRLWTLVALAFRALKIRSKLHFAKRLKTSLTPWSLITLVQWKAIFKSFAFCSPWDFLTIWRGSSKSILLWTRTKKILTVVLILGRRVPKRSKIPITFGNGSAQLLTTTFQIFF